MQTPRVGDALLRPVLAAAVTKPRDAGVASFESVLQQQGSASEGDEGAVTVELELESGEGAAITVEVGCDAHEQFDEATVRHLARILWQSSARGVKRLVLRLRPDHLGELTLVLTVKGKQLFVEARSARSDTLRLLAAAQGALAEALARWGVELAALRLESDDEERTSSEAADLVGGAAPRREGLSELTVGVAVPPRSFMEVIA
ncbi:MAG: flagellar hook-length control protein FliK [Deltaproteobacteria bacterium]|nr:flagellar hook-length control protein FliK [Deltaproteobacteria bacterium]